MNCDGIARWYRALEYLVFGRALERRRLEFMNRMTDARSVLILGDGDGRFTAEFVRRNPEAKVDSIDLSPRMIKIAKRRAGDLASQVNFRVGDARTVSLAGKYDLVVTHFFLDCFTDQELDAVVARVSEHCEPGASWVLSEFALPEGGLPRIGARLLIRFMYFCFWVLTGLTVKNLPPCARIMANFGFRLNERRVALGGLLASEMWELLSTEGDHGINSGGAPSR